MSRLAQKIKVEKQKELVAKYAAKRKLLKEALASQTSSLADKELARKQLEDLPRDSSPTRLRNRCLLTGRARGYLRKFEMCRHEFRRLALQGEIPGVVKSSW